MKSWDQRRNCDDGEEEERKRDEDAMLLSLKMEERRSP